MFFEILMSFFANDWHAKQEETYTYEDLIFSLTYALRYHVLSQEGKHVEIDRRHFWAEVFYQIHKHSQEVSKVASEKHKKSYMSNSFKEK